MIFYRGTMIAFEESNLQEVDKHSLIKAYEQVLRENGILPI